MRIALVRGDFASPWELQNFHGVNKTNDLELFTGIIPVNDLENVTWLDVSRLFSPADLNFGHISRLRMALLNRVFGDAHYMFGLERRLIGFDIAHCAETYYGFTNQCIRAKKSKYVKCVVSTVWENIPHNNEGIIGRKDIKERAFKFIDKFLPTSETSSKVLQLEGCDPKKISVLKPGVDQHIFSRHIVTSFRNIQKNNCTDILCVGRLEKEKGVLNVLEAFKILASYYPNVRLLIAGSGPLAEDLQRLSRITLTKNVFLLGRVKYEEMPSLYSFADIFVHYPVGSGTWQEQYGMVLVEAMSCALPIVALDRGSINEIVGNAGCVVREEAFIKTLIAVVKSISLRSKLSQKSLIKSKREYDSDTYSRKLVKIYEDTLRLNR